MRLPVILAASTSARLASHGSCTVTLLGGTNGPEADTDCSEELLGLGAVNGMPGPT